MPGRSGPLVFRTRHGRVAFQAGTAAYRALARIVANQSRMRANRAQRTNNNNSTSDTNTLSGVNPLTTQHDFKVDYKRRKRTRKLKRRVRRARKFTRRVVNSYMRATTTPKHVAKLALFTIQTITGQSNYFGCLLHSSDGLSTGDNPQADWREFFREGSTENAVGWDQIADPTAPPQFPDVNRRNRAMRCNSSAMELTIRNTGANACLVNVYRIVCKLSFPFVQFSIESLYDQGFRYSGRITEVTQPVEGTGNDGVAPPFGMWDPQMQGNQLTSTPFQSSLFTKHFTIYRRTKYQLAPGEEFSLMVKDNRPKHIDMNRMRGNSFVKGITHGYFIDFQGVPIQVGGDPSTTSTAPASLSVQKMVRYSLNMLPEKRTATSFDVQDP